MKNINKENFFNVMQLKYPERMKHFYKWIDEYKSSVNWYELFNHGYYITNSTLSKQISSAPKFHHLPFEMQYGIIVKYIKDTVSENVPKPLTEEQQFYIDEMPMPCNYDQTVAVLEAFFDEETKRLSKLNKLIYENQKTTKKDSKFSVRL